ncbi:MAG: response regulator transcription factor [Gemmatimonadetes bacterium]|nr:response regulator transcription factor [Gemmatimonadota bacterium]
MTIRVLLVDDHELMREALRARFAQDDEFEVVAEAGDARTAVEQAAACRPDIVVMDVALPDLSGVEATRQILAQAPEVKVVALSMHEEPHFVAGMLEVGASGYVVKGAARTGAEVMRAARAALAGGTYLSPELAGAVYDQVQALAGHPKLSAQEREVVRLISKGLKTAEIAKRLNLSDNTVNTYRKRIMDKLDLHSIAALTRYAISTGLTSL